MRASYAVCLVVVAALAAGIAAATGPVAMVAELSGSAHLTSGDDSRDLKLFARLSVGDAIVLDAEAEAVVAFVSGARFRIEGPAEVRVAEDDLKAVKGSVSALQPVGTVPAIAAIPSGEKPGRRSGAIRIRSASLWGSEVESLYPRDGASAVAGQTTLSFQPLVNAETYRVDVEDELGETVFALETRTTEVTVPKGVLLPGAEYYWRVRSAGRRSLGGRGEALFKTLPEDQAGAREGIRLQAEQDGEVASLLLLAEVDRSLGLYREACQSLTRAGELAPENAHIAAARESFPCEEYAP